LFNTEEVIDLRYLASLKSLESLELSSMSGNEFIFSDTLENLENLNSITVKNINCADWLFLTELNSLKSIELNYCLYDYIKTFNKNINDFDFSVLNSCEELESLKVLSFHFDFSNISNLKQLKSIHLGTTGEAGMTVENFNQVSECNALETFFVYMVSVDNNDFSALQKCTYLNDLTFSFTSVASFDWLTNMNQLNKFCSVNSDFTDLTLLYNLKNLSLIEIVEEFIKTGDFDELRKHIGNTCEIKLY
jgi:hypothetical protein